MIGLDNYFAQIDALADELGVKRIPARNASERLYHLAHGSSLRVQLIGGVAEWTPWWGRDEYGQFAWNDVPVMTRLGELRASLPAIDISIRMAPQALVKPLMGVPSGFHPDDFAWPPKQRTKQKTWPPGP